MLVTIVGVMLVVVMAVDFGLKNESHLVRTVVVMVRHKSVQ